VLKHFEKKYVEHHGEDGSVSFDDVEVTPQNSEKYIQFQIGNLRFLDSFQFLSTSLQELLSLPLKSGKDNFVHTTAYLGTDDDIIFAKGVYPYSYVDSRDKFANTQLPSISEFHDKLKNEPLSAEDYLRAQITWDRFGCETSKDYHDHSLLTDVLLLADVFENFRKTVLKNTVSIRFILSAFPRLSDGFKTYRSRVGSYYRPRRISHVGNKFERWYCHHFQEICVGQQ